MHSYWDDFWALKGYDSAAMLAAARDRPDDERRFAAARDEFRTDLVASLRATAALHRHRLSRRARPSSAISIRRRRRSRLHLAAAARYVPQELVVPTFERYWREFVARRDGSAQWDEYTPYELRNAATFLRLGWRERAHELLEFFMAAAGRRRGINGRRSSHAMRARRVRRRSPACAGWRPITSVACSTSSRTSASDGAMVLAGGIPAAWLDRAGIAIRGLRTPYGTLAYSLVRTGERIAEMTLSASGRVRPADSCSPVPGRGRCMRR